MTDQNGPELSHPFPRTRPDLKIAESTEKIDQVDCLELRWWFAIPRLGDHTMWASYEADTLELTSVTDMVATVPTRIHGVDCVEIQAKEWSAEKGWAVADSLHYGRIGREDTRWVAVITKEEGTKVFFTSVDEGFEDDWGRCDKRKLCDDGRYQLQADGSYRITNGKGIGAGVYDVTIGESKFCCLRVLDTDSSEGEGGVLVEAYIEREGRTVLFRRYNGRLWRGTDWAQKHPGNAAIVINGNVYVHWYDCVPDHALIAGGFPAGIKERPAVCEHGSARAPWMRGLAPQPPPVEKAGTRHDPMVSRWGRA